MSNISKKIKHELRELIPAWIYFLVAFSMLKLTQTVLLEEYGITVFPTTQVVIGSLIVAKVLLLANLFRFVGWFDLYPGIVAAAWKTAIYSIGALVVRYLEGLLEGMHRHHFSFIETNHRIAQYVTTSRFWVIQMWVVALLFVFCSARELIRRIGEARVSELFFGTHRGSGNQ
jgi:hypothetical protein